MFCWPRLPLFHIAFGPEFDPDAGLQETPDHPLTCYVVAPADLAKAGAIYFATRYIWCMVTWRIRKKAHDPMCFGDGAL